MTNEDHMGLRDLGLERYEAAADLLDFDLTPVAQNSPWHQGARSG